MNLKTTYMLTLHPVAQKRIIQTTTYSTYFKYKSMINRLNDLNRRHGVEKFELDFDPEHTTPARVFRASLPGHAGDVCPEKRKPNS